MEANTNKYKAENYKPIIFSSTTRWHHLATVPWVPPLSPFRGLDGITSPREIACHLFTDAVAAVTARHDVTTAQNSPPWHSVCENNTFAPCAAQRCHDPDVPAAGQVPSSPLLAPSEEAVLQGPLVSARRPCVPVCQVPR